MLEWSSSDLYPGMSSPSQHSIKNSIKMCCSLTSKTAKTLKYHTNFQIIIRYIIKSDGNIFSWTRDENSFCFMALNGNVTTVEKTSII